MTKVITQGQNRTQPTAVCMSHTGTYCMGDMDVAIHR